MNSIAITVAVLVLIAIADSGTANAQAQRWNRIAELPAYPTAIEILNDSTTLIGTATPSLLLLRGSSVMWEMRFDTTKLPHLDYPRGMIVDILAWTDSTVLLAFQFGNARTVNIRNRTTEELHFLPINDLARSGNGTIVASARFRSTDNAVSWDSIKDDKVIEKRFRSVVGGVHDNFYGTPDYSGLWRSTDGGVTWMEREALRQTPDSLTGAATPFVYDEKTVVVFASNSRTIEGKNNGLYKTTDDGQTWHSVLRVDSAYVKLHAQDGNLTFVTMAKSTTDVTHTYTSTDFGETWSLIDEGFPINITLGAMTTREGRTLLAASHVGGRSLYRLEAVSSADQESIANGSIGELVVKTMGEYLEVEFTSENAKPAHAWCDDVQGRRVISERVIEGGMGKRIIRFDSGGLPSGTYFITVEQGEKRRTEGVKITR
ncbi:MAG: hypothetical protein IT211_07725 [Armatimonadetes bacterium]|nr:hypothetical protein [Armatimonadota bacterium]